MSEREYEALRSALASVRMEGFHVTEQTEIDCIRLMNGEVSAADLVKRSRQFSPSRLQKGAKRGVSQRLLIGCNVKGGNTDDRNA